MHELPLILAAAEGSPLLRDLVIILVAAAVVAVGLQRLRLATVPAYLITGALIGPGALGFVGAGNVQAISDLAIVLLLFGVGLHMDLSVLARGLKQMLLGTIFGALLCTLALWPLAMLLGVTPAGGLVVAMAMSISSTVVVLRVLLQRRELAYPEGRLTFGVLILQDLVAIVLLLLLPPLARWNGSGQVGVISGTGAETGFDLVLNMLANGGIAIGGIGLIVLAGRYVLPRMLTEAARSKSSEVLIVLTTAAALGAAALTQHLINNAAMGAFLAGFLVSATPFRHQIGGQIGAIRDLFSAVFFTAIGMSVSFAVVLDAWPIIALGTPVMLLIKGGLLALALWGTGATGNIGFKSGMALAQAGEFSVLMLASAKAAQLSLISEHVAGVSIAIIVLSLIVTPGLITFAARVNTWLPRIPAPRWARSAGAEPPVAPGLRGVSGGEISANGKPLHAIVAGFGLVGRAVNDELKRMGMSSTIIDLNPATIRAQTRLGRHVVFGDASNEDVLESAGIHHADLLVLTIPDEESVLRACSIARQIKPDIFIIARANYVSQGVVAAGMGADGVVVEEMATAKEMETVVRRVLEARRAAAAST